MVLGWFLFGVVWTITVFGILLQTLFMNRWPKLSLLLYLAMGWLIVLVWDQLSAAASPTLLTFLIAGGLSYTVGAVFYALGNRWSWFHPIWHVFVLAGTACHFFAAMAILT